MGGALFCDAIKHLNTDNGHRKCEELIQERLKLKQFLLNKKISQLI
jgi:hypothetical protein